MKRKFENAVVWFVIVSLAISPVMGQIPTPVVGKVLDGGVAMIFSHCEFEEFGTCGTFDSLECGWPFAGNNLCVSTI